MRYIVDHDLHIHSKISPCSRDDRQCKEAILAYGLTNRFKLVGVTDHFWDLNVDYGDAPGWLDVGEERWRSILPLPQSKECRFLFGAEVDMNRHQTIGICERTLGMMDYTLISTGHLHLKNFVTDVSKFPRTPEFVKEYYLGRLKAFLAHEEYPFERMGMTHFHSCIIGEDKLVQTLGLFSDEELEELFADAARKGVGVELNAESIPNNPEVLEAVLRPYQIAKNQGCKFYLAGDAHHPEAFRITKEMFEHWVDLLGLQESDKWPFVTEQIEKLSAEN